jgi:hypothetical protein
MDVGPTQEDYFGDALIVRSENVQSGRILKTVPIVVIMPVNYSGNIFYSIPVLKTDLRRSETQTNSKR